MKLTDLEPRWLTPDVFIFRCPCCREMWLSCKRVPLSISDQMDLFRDALAIEKANRIVVPMQQDYAWRFSSDDFSTLTVSPLIDASRSGHWHGVIRNGEVT